MIVTIDGPAGAGKSSTARALARRLGFEFLDTGAMYRAVALATIESGIDFSDRAAMQELVERIEIHVSGNHTFLDGVDVSDRIRTTEVTAATRDVADHPGIRARLVELQRSIAIEKSVVTEGRDQGTVAFPYADCKIFLTATPEERARRRAQEMAGGNAARDWQLVLAEQTDRDRRDESRPVGRLQKAEDAIEIVGDHMTAEQVVDAAEAIVRAAM